MRVGLATSIATAIAIGVLIAGGGNPANCSGAANHVPGGADGTGTCWPGVDNTGPSVAQGNLPNYTGTCSINTDNTTIDSMVITRAQCGVVNVNGDNVTISNSYLFQGITQGPGSTNLQIENVVIDNAVPYAACTGPTSCPAGDYACGDPNNQTTDCGVTGFNFDIYRSEIFNTNRAVYCQAPGPCTIQDNYFHGTNLWPDDSDLAHASSVRNEQNLTIRHNSMFCDYQGPFPNEDIGCSADMSGYPDFVPIKNDTIDHNLLGSNNVGIAYCMYGGGTAGKPHSNDPDNATNIVVTNNVFQGGANNKCGGFYWVTDFLVGNSGNVWSGNVLDDGSTAGPD